MHYVILLRFPLSSEFQYQPQLPMVAYMIQLLWCCGQLNVDWRSGRTEVQGGGIRLGRPLSIAPLDRDVFLSFCFFKEVLSRTSNCIMRPVCGGKPRLHSHCQRLYPERFYAVGTADFAQELPRRYRVSPIRSKLRVIWGD